MIKNLWRVSLAVSLVFSLSSCSSDDNEIIDVVPETTNNITFFAIEGNEGVIREEISNDALDNNITVTVPNDTDLTNVVPTIVHEGIRVDPEEGQAQNFTNQVIYTVTAENGDEKRFVVRVLKEGDAFTLTFANTQRVTIPINPDPSLTYNYEVDSDGDGVFEGPFNIDATFDFQTTGPHTLRIRGQFPAIQFGSTSGATMADKVVSLDQWGSIVWQSMEGAFKGCTNMEVPATDVPNLSNVVTMEGMFDGAAKANPDVSAWEVGNVRIMARLFRDASAATPDVEGWGEDLVNVQNMSSMFERAIAAKPNTSNWNVSNVTNMSNMFAGAVAANPNTSNWNVSNVTNMKPMFKRTTETKPNKSKWNLRKVTKK